MCVELREVTFRKISKLTKSKWVCNKCKFNEKQSINDTEKPVINITNENFNNLSDSVNFMSYKFDKFGAQLQELLSAIKEMREENRVLKKQNIKFNNEIILFIIGKPC